MTKSIFKFAILFASLFVSQLSAQPIRIPQIETARKSMSNKCVTIGGDRLCRMELKDAEKYCLSRNKHLPTVEEMATITTFFGAHGIDQAWDKRPYSQEIVYSIGGYNTASFNYFRNGFSILNERAKVLMTPEEWEEFVKDRIEAHQNVFEINYRGYWTTSFDPTTSFNPHWLFDPLGSDMFALSQYKLNHTQRHAIICVGN